MKSVFNFCKQNGYNVLSSFYNVVPHDDDQKPIFVGGADFYILGVKYETKKLSKEYKVEDASQILQYASMALFSRMKNLICCTYRSNYAVLSNSTLTTDVGWGCTIRAVQMLICNSIQQIKYNPKLLDTKVPYVPTNSEVQYVVFPVLDIDSPAAPLSIHNLYKRKGINEVNKTGANHLPSSIVSREYCELVNSWKQCVIRCVFCANSKIPDDQLRAKPFKPTLVFVPVVFDSDNMSKLKMVYTNSLFSGMVGGVGDRAIYIFGFNANQFIYLDPHTVYPACPDIAHIDLPSYSAIDQTRKKFFIHTIFPQKIDKFVTFGFLLKKESDIDAFMTLVDEAFGINNKSKEMKKSTELDGFEVLDF